MYAVSRRKVARCHNISQAHPVLIPFGGEALERALDYVLHCTSWSIDLNAERIGPCNSTRPLEVAFGNLKDTSVALTDFSHHQPSLRTDTVLNMEQQ